jgi:thioredoxin 1
MNPVSQARTGARSILTVDDATFPTDVLAADVPVLVEFGATWCPPCRALEPLLAELAGEAGGRWRVVKVDMDESPALAARFAVRGAPTVIAFAKGAEVGRHLGMTRREVLVGLIEQASARR